VPNATLTGFLVQPMAKGLGEAILGFRRDPEVGPIVLLGTGGCTAYDVVLILRKSGQDVRGCEVALTADRADADPKVFTRIGFRFTVRGRGLKPNVVERAIKLSHDKYCSATAMLAKTAEITIDWTIVED
jgi:putative redox protein